MYKPDWQNGEMNRLHMTATEIVSHIRHVWTVRSQNEKTTLGE